MCDVKNSINRLNIKNGRTLFIVEDDKELQEIYSLFFRNTDWEITCQAYNGIEAISKYKELYKSSPPSIVLLDINLPGCSGTIVAKTILEQNPKQNIMFISANICQLKNEQSLYGFPKMEKPFSFIELIEKINNFDFFIQNE